MTDSPELCILSAMDVKIEASWKERLASEFESPYFAKLAQFVRSEYGTKRIYPPAKLLFNAFNLCPLASVRVVILGQDPYHGPGQAHGLSFSVPAGVPIPPSLRNIYQEIRDDLGIPVPHTGDLEPWARQGVLLLNATLSVAAHAPMSHHNRGWEQFTDGVIRSISDTKQGVVFMLWGRSARAKAAIIDPQKHLILEAAHPSPFSAHSGFFGCKHFSKANDYLLQESQEPIRWGSPGDATA